MEHPPRPPAAGEPPAPPRLSPPPPRPPAPDPHPPRPAPRWRALAEGRPVLLPLAALGLAAARLYRPAAPLALLALGAAALSFRDPERPVPHRPGLALAPADGRVLHVRPVWDPYWQTDLLEIAIFLALWDVHVQRSPLAGQVVAQHHRPGAYRTAMSPAATHANAQLATYLRTPAGPCVVTQISGLLARRIVTWTAPGAELAQGERLGLIRFGSQVTLRLPMTATVLVGVGDRVRAGLTPVAAHAASEARLPQSPSE